MKLIIAYSYKKPEWCSDWKYSKDTLKHGHMLKHTHVLSGLYLTSNFFFFL